MVQFNIKLMDMQEIFLFKSGEYSSFVALNRKLNDNWKVLSSNLVSTDGPWYVYAYLLEKVY